MWRSPICLRLIFLLLALFGTVQTRPCPRNAYFVASDVHKADVCACARGYICGGSKCLQGSDDNHPLSFDASTEGFAADCMDCGCVSQRKYGDASKRELAQTAKTLLEGTFRILPTTDGGSMRDFIDPLFEASCHVQNDVPIPRPKALRYMNWLHFPK
jgi:hypothetical protein